MKNQALVDLVAEMEAWKRKLLLINGTYYISLPRSVVEASNKKKGSMIQLKRGVDKESGKLVFILDL